MLKIPDAVPRKILEMMEVEGLTRDHVASHLQVIFISFIHDAFVCPSNILFVTKFSYVSEIPNTVKENS